MPAKLLQDFRHLFVQCCYKKESLVFDMGSDFHKFVIDLFVICGPISDGIWGSLVSCTILQAPLGAEVGAEKVRTGKQVYL